MTRPFLPLFAIILLNTPACRGEDLDDPVDLQITARLVDDTVALTNARADLLCDCSDDYGFRSLPDCREYFEYLDEDEHECMRDAFETDPVASRDFLECTTAVGERLVECLEPMTCGDGMLFEACHEAFNEGTAKCPELPFSVLAGLRSCTG
jgi:hypothetical protein